MATKLFKNWEKEKNIMVNIPDVSDENQRVTEEYFQQIVDLYGFTGVNHDDRIKFLKDNNYEVTRENMTADLSSRQAEVE